METLAYLHLALTYEEPLTSEEVALNSSKLQLVVRQGRALLKRGNYCLLAWGTAIGLCTATPNALAVLQQGDQNPQVTRVQKRLQELKFFPEEPTGYFGEVTVDAVKKFQRDRGMTPDGIIGAETEAALFSTTNQTDNPFNSDSFLSNSSAKPFVVSSQNPNSKAKSEQTPKPSIASHQDKTANTQSEQNPSASEEESFLAEKLTPAPSVAEPESIVQESAEQPPKAEGQTPSKTELLTLGKRGELVKQLQTKLNDAGFSPGAIDGIYGQQTRKAVIAFQRSRGLFVDGVAGQQTLSTLKVIASEPSQRLYTVKVRNS
jgi:peptidoglycan hydrolase-like protein with peptidoglycan-binding domain